MKTRQCNSVLGNYHSSLVYILLIRNYRKSLGLITVITDFQRRSEMLRFVLQVKMIGKGVKRTHLNLTTLTYPKVPASIVI